MTTTVDSSKTGIVNQASVAITGGSIGGAPIVRRQVADRCAVHYNLVAGLKQVQSRSRHRIYNTVRALRFQFSSEKASQANTPIWSGGVPVTVKAALEYNGTIYPITFSGSRTGTIADGGYIDSDDLSVNIPANSIVFVRQLITNASGSTGMLLAPQGNNGGLNTSSTELDCCETSATVSLTDKVDSGTIANSAGGYITYPCAITSLLPYDNGASLHVGDSITTGSGDSPNNVFSGVGMLSRSVGRKYPWCQVAIFGGSSWFLAGISNNYLLGSRAAGTAAARLAQYTTRVISAFGQNQLRTGATSAQVWADHKLMMDNLNYVAGYQLSYAFTTLMPYTTSTDSWATTANQTVNYTSLAELQAYNATVRAGTYSGYTGQQPVGYIDFAGAVDTSTFGGSDTGIWKANFTADGIHPLAAAYKQLELVNFINIPNY